MSPKLEGEAPSVKRIETGLYSFDRAVGNPRTGEHGFPLWTIIELFGHEHCGKSTLSYYLAGCADPKGTIVVADMEGFDPEYMLVASGQSGFDGIVRIIPQTEKKKFRAHEDMLTDLTGSLLEDAVVAGIFDSVSSFAPRSEVAGEYGERHIGARAFTVAQFSRETVRVLRLASDLDQPKNVFVINHQYQIIGGMGYSTAGGRVLAADKNLSIRMWRSASPKDKLESELDHFVVHGKVQKLRFGGKGREFKVAMLAGQGVHRGMTALIDCVHLGLAERGAVVKIGDKSLGRISELIAAAEDGDDKKFKPFYETLEASDERNNSSD